MPQDAWKTISGTMMTTERIGAYGGFRFSREALESAAAAIRLNGLPMHVEHDLRRPLRTRNIDAFVESREDGIDMLQFTLEIHLDDAHWVDTFRAISFTITTPLPRPLEYLEPESPRVSLSADNAWFDDESILAAESAIRSNGVSSEDVLAERAFQFSFVPDPQIFMTVSVALLTGVAANALWSGVVHLFRSRRTPAGGNADRPTIVNLTLVDGDASMTAVVETESEVVAMRALENIDELVEALRERKGAQAKEEKVEPSAVVWNDTSGSWTPPT